MAVSSGTGQAGATETRGIARHWAAPLVPPIAGMLSGALEIGTLWPLEWAKVQAQLNRGNPSFSILAHARKTGHALYRGLPPLLIGAPLQCAVRFSALEGCRAYLPAASSGSPSRSTDLVAGVLAGAVEAALVVTPMETIKTQLVDSNAGLVAREGLAGLYRGLSATVAKSASNQALRFLVYGEYKRRVATPGAPLGAAQAMGGGMLAGLIGAVGNTPVDMIKTRMQGLAAARYSSTLDCLATVVREEGLLALYKGLAMRCARVVPGQGIIFCTYEVVSVRMRARLEAVG